MKGDIFCVIAFLTGRPRTASVFAEDSLAVFELTRPILERMLKRNPDIMDYLDETYHLRVKDGAKKINEVEDTLTNKKDKKRRQRKRKI